MKNLELNVQELSIEDQQNIDGGHPLLALAVIVGVSYAAYNLYDNLSNK